MNEYARENQDIVDKLKLAIQEKKIWDAAQIVHRLDSSGSIGAKPLHDVSMELQKF